MRSSWIPLVPPKSNNNCPYERHTEEKTQGRGPRGDGAEVGAMLPQAQEHPAPRSWESWETPPTAPGRSANALILDFQGQKCGKINFCCYKPPNLW